MKTLKSTVAALAICGFTMAPVASMAGDDAADPIGDAVNDVGCAIVTVVTLPIKILTGGEPGCK